jgi:hypothetical protein
MRIVQTKSAQSQAGGQGMRNPHDTITPEERKIGDEQITGLECPNHLTGSHSSAEKIVTTYPADEFGLADVEPLIQRVKNPQIPLRNENVVHIQAALNRSYDIRIRRAIDDDDLHSVAIVKKTNTFDGPDDPRIVVTREDDSNFFT